MLQKKRLKQKNPVMRLIRDKARKYYKITETIGCKKKKKKKICSANFFIS